MTLEIVDKSDVKGDINKEKKSELIIVEESDMKKAWNKKDPWLDVVDESDVRKVDDRTKKHGLELITKEHIISCERQMAGLINNCTICKELTRDRFDRCPNKYGGY